MSRIGSILVQNIDDAGVVILDERTGQEVYVPMERVHSVIKALEYSVSSFVSRGVGEQDG